MSNGFKKRLALVFGFATCFSAAAIAQQFGECEITGKKGAIPIEHPVAEGKLTVSGGLPVPVWWNGENAQSIVSGIEYCLAAEIAWRAGYSELALISVGWEPLIAGTLEGYDVAFSQASYADDRKKVHDFTPAYYYAPLAVLGRSNRQIDIKDFSKLKIGVQYSTTAFGFLTAHFLDADIVTFPSQTELFASLRSEQIDLAVTDFPLGVLEQRQTDSASKVVAKIVSDERYVGLMKIGNANNGKVSEIVQSIVDDGTMEKIIAKWQLPEEKGMLESVPNIEVPK